MTVIVNAPDWAHPQTDLTGSTVLLIGGTGGVGEGVAHALLGAGATVVATGRTRERLDDLAGRLASPRLVTAVLDLLDPGLPEAVTALVREHGPLGSAVVSVADWGGQGRKRVIDHTDDEWDALIAQNLTTIFRAYRALIPALSAEGAIIQLNGLSADLPFPGAGGRALTAAATKSMTRTIAEELQGSGPRVYEVILGLIGTRSRQLAGFDDPTWIPPTDVGVHVAELVAGTSPLAGSVLHYLVERADGPRSA
ncbi:SDR family oxidoreductase [Actinoplanes solisilvae]|uniref:SDR family oxidoreductase n=1 Tax=Actinoplanes solisilvae TaxID=2486853 RepID=UPI000FD98215|nr:SDR family oxidoreductase [Actinoplanes solisilvae]